MTCTIISDKSEIKTEMKNEHEEPYLTIKRRLREIIWNEFCGGTADFYVNCEYGIPLWAAEIICALKKYNDIRLHIVVPYEEQALNWTEEQRDRYYFLHEHSDSVTFACYGFEPDCYQTADRIMAENSDKVLIFGSPEDRLYIAGYAVENGVAIRFFQN